MKRSSFHKAVLSIFALAILVALSEGAARFLWRNPPPAIGPVSATILQQSGDPATGRTLIPNVKKYNTYTNVSTNADGLRGAATREKNPGEFRILMVGDEAVFGQGLREEDALPGLMEAQLSRFNAGRAVSVVNAGVPGFDLSQSVALAEKLAPLYAPDVVLVSFSHDDLDVSGFEGDRQTPPWNAAPKPEPDYNLLSQKLSLRLLPPSNAAAGRIKYGLARLSRLYLFAAMELQRRGMSQIPAENFSALLASPSCAAEQNLYGRLEKSLKALRRAADKFGFRPALFLTEDFRMGPELPLRAESGAREYNIEFVNLSWLWPKSLPEHERIDKLGWLAQPNARANRLAANALTAFLSARKLLGGLMAANPEAYRKETQAELHAKYVQMKEEADREFSERVGAFSSGAQFANRATWRDEQLLYGWWPEKGYFQRLNRDGRWIADNAWILLKNEGAETLRLQGQALNPGKNAEPHRVSFSLNCSPLDGTFDVAGVVFSIERPIPQKWNGLSWLTVGVHVENAVTLGEAGLSDDDRRVASLLVKNIELAGSERDR